MCSVLFRPEPSRSPDKFDRANLQNPQSETQKSISLMSRTRPTDTTNLSIARVP